MLCNKVLLKETIKLEPRYLVKSFKDEILHRLKQKVEGICTKHGYIKKGSVELYKVTPGVIELVSLCGNILYEVFFYADVCNPLIGSVIKSAKVVNLNRLGILAEVHVSDDKFSGSVIEIIIAKNSVNIISDIDLDKIKVGDEINVEVVGKKFNINDKKVSVIGRIVKEVKEPRYKTAYKVDAEEDEEEYLDEVVEVEEDEEEEAEAEAEEDEEVEAEVEAEEDEEVEEDDEFFSEDFEEHSAGFSDDGAPSDVESI